MIFILLGKFQKSCIIPFGAIYVPAVVHLPEPFDAAHDCRFQLRGSGDLIDLIRLDGHDLSWLGVWSENIGGFLPSVSSSLGSRCGCACSGGRWEEVPHPGESRLRGPECNSQFLRMRLPSSDRTRRSSPRPFAG